jgi:lipopolysaccharide/colanic/teichoic acid biosynthesis glycosyltransferase
MFTAEERLILTVRPGITDWATLSNPDEGAVLAGSPDPDKTYLEEIRPEKLRLQLEYVKRQSVSTDLIIFGRTIFMICSKVLRA